jgi:predicted transcriptional regulator
MELMMRSAMKDSVIPGVTKVVYATGPDQMQRMLASGSVDVGCIWEPYATILEAQGAHRVIRYSELTEHVCCALAAGNHLNEKLVSEISKQYELSMDLFRRDPEEHLSAYGALSGLDTSLLRRVSREYSYPGRFTPGVVERQFESAGMVLPSSSTFEDSLLSS